MNELEKLKDLILHAKNQLSNQNDQFPKEIEKPLSSSGRNELKSGDGKRLGNLELIEKGEQMDEDEFQKLQEELERRRNEARQKLNLDEQDTKDLFESKIVNQFDDGDDFKKQMMDEMNEKFGKIDGILQTEEDAQLTSLEKKLLARKQR